MRSKYIVIEGLEGAGKTTARNVVVDTLKALGVADMVFTREPGGTQLAEKLRSLVLDIKSVGDEVITDKAEVLMLASQLEPGLVIVLKADRSGGTSNLVRLDLMSFRAFAEAAAKGGAQ